MTKKVSQKIHAKRRAFQRYNVELNRHDLREIVKLIQDNKGRLVEKQSLRVSVWDITYNNIEFRVVYDKARKNIATFLPLTKEDAQN